MKKVIFYLIFLLAAGPSLPASAKGISPVGVDSLSYDRHGDYMVLEMGLNLASTKVRSTRAQIMTPLIVSPQGDTIALQPVGVYGRQRYLNYLRNGRHPIGAPNEKIVRDSERPDTLSYRQSVNWQPWMDESEVVMRRRLYGCTNCLIEETVDPLAEYFRLDPAIPEIVYFPAQSQEVKTDTIEGQAFIDFVVNKTDIRPDYRNNTRELGKIRASVDTVINDSDVRVTEIWLKGYASPESPYSHNRDLAIGRTASLKDYIRQHYQLPEEIMATDFEPEDWEGLRRLVVESDIDNKNGILELIDSDMAPDAKEAKIRRAYPKEYKLMLQEFYPPLRHTDYRITYEIKRFDDIDKIREVMRSRPSRLSLREFFLLGNAAEPGSDEFNEVFETAVRMFPDNNVANINAANAALQRQDYTTAERYLQRAGSSPEAVYARGALAFLQGDYDTAEKLMKEASAIPASKSTLNEINRIRAHAKQKSTSVSLK